MNRSLNSRALMAALALAAVAAFTGCDRRGSDTGAITTTPSTPSTTTTPSPMPPASAASQ